MIFPPPCPPPPVSGTGDISQTFQTGFLILVITASKPLHTPSRYSFSISSYNGVCIRKECHTSLPSFLIGNNCVKTPSYPFSLFLFNIFIQRSMYKERWPHDFAIVSNIGNNRVNPFIYISLFLFNIFILRSKYQGRKPHVFAVVSNVGNTATTPSYTSLFNTFIK